jgi:hypothetical protein
MLLLAQLPHGARCDYGPSAQFQWPGEATSLCLGEPLPAFTGAVEGDSSIVAVRQVCVRAVDLTIGLMSARSSPRERGQMVPISVYGERHFAARDKALRFVTSALTDGRAWDRCASGTAAIARGCTGHRVVRMSNDTDVDEYYTVYGSSSSRTGVWTVRYGKALRSRLRVPSTVTPTGDDPPLASK